MNTADTLTCTPEGACLIPEVTIGPFPTWGDPTPIPDGADLAPALIAEPTTTVPNTLPGWDGSTLPFTGPRADVALLIVIAVLGILIGLTIAYVADKLEGS